MLPPPVKAHSCVLGRSPWFSCRCQSLRQHGWQKSGVYCWLVHALPHEGMSFLSGRMSLSPGASIMRTSHEECQTGGGLQSHDRWQGRRTSEAFQCCSAYLRMNPGIWRFPTKDRMRRTLLLYINSITWYNVENVSIKSFLAFPTSCCGSSIARHVNPDPPDDSVAFIRRFCRVHCCERCDVSPNNVSQVVQTKVRRVHSFSLLMKRPSRE